MCIARGLAAARTALVTIAGSKRDVRMNLPAEGAGAAPQSLGDGSDAFFFFFFQCNRVAL